ncbi:MAG: hypothetical protein D6776_03110 [Planctomycetota bacterium]|nr:MAG: hypothetical protein D6776_03110 [Planctomycetota bacterium]
MSRPTRRSPSPVRSLSLLAAALGTALAFGVTGCRTTVRTGPPPKKKKKVVIVKPASTHPALAPKLDRKR